jgi:anion-transporting  ArsA/GET3 family ATPase
MKFEDLLHKKIIICIGSGGVGKTSLSAAIGLWAARHAAKRVLILTVDPAKRLATTLGMDLRKEISSIEAPGITGRLSASVLDSKKTFDEFVMRAARKIPGADQILKNKLYQQLSTTLAGSQEFSAIEKLYSLYESGEYDLIVLDTPPTKHAIDFLRAPQKIAALFQDRVAAWFRSRKAGGTLLGSLFHSGTQKVLSLFEKLTGSDFIRELNEFFGRIESWQGALEERTMAIQKLLASDQTGFVLVTGFDEPKIAEARYFIREIRKDGYDLQQVLINRAVPQWFFDTPDTEAWPPHLLALYKQAQHFYSERSKSYQEFIQEISVTVQIKKLPEFDDDISDLEDLEKLLPYFLERKL